MGNCNAPVCDVTTNQDRVREDITDICNKRLTNAENHKKLNINKSTLYDMQKHIKEGKKIKVYGKIMEKIGV